MGGEAGSIRIKIGIGRAGAASENESSAATTEEDRAEASSEAETDGDGTQGKPLVVYFSATGNTERVAEIIADTTGGELFELEPVDPYTDEDLNYNDDNSRVAQEYADESLRNVELVADTVDDWQDVERIYIGYPIWWQVAAWPVNQFVENNDFTGKTVIPFCTSACTSASSGIGDSGQLLEEMAGTGNWLEGESAGQVLVKKMFGYGLKGLDYKRILKYKRT